MAMTKEEFKERVFKWARKMGVVPKEVPNSCQFLFKSIYL